jgi:hypothetical protein
MMQIGEENLNSTDKKELRKFGLLIGSVFMVIGIIPLLKGRELNLYLIFVAIPIILLGLIIPVYLSPVYKIWMKIGKVLGRINSFLILSVIFYLVVTPIGFIYRIFKADSRKFAYRTNNDSYWIRRHHNNPKEDMKRLF